MPAHLSLPVVARPAAARPARFLLIGLLAISLLLASACGSTATDGVAPGAGPPATTAAADTGATASTPASAAGTASTTPSVSAPTTTAPPSTAPPSTAPPTTPTAAPPTTAAGGPAAGEAEVRQAQERLLALGYWLGVADGKPGADTVHAVTAFQKVEGLKRTGRLDATTVARLSTAARPRPHTTTGRAVEVDRTHQVVLAVRDGAVQWVFDVSTGKASTPTPAGTFRVTWQVDGIRDAPLGRLYRPKYFNDGIALHGYTSVPASAASHGCVRLTYRAMDFVWSAGLAPVGTTVVVY